MTESGDTVPATGGRTLVIDASLNRRLVGELKGRGRPAVSVADLGLGRATDGELLRGLARRLAGEEWVLVTADDSLPEEQADLLDRLGLTVATVEWRSRAPRAGREQAARDTCHRWAHAMAAQPARSRRRYSPERNRRWASRRR
jgi:hypothetical protein